MKSENKKVFIDSSTFLGMHSDNERICTESVNFFVSHYHSTIYLSLEQVGVCDDVIWGYSRTQQDQYYPFMDRLHTEMDIQRLKYSFNDIGMALQNEELRRLDTPKALLVAQVLNNDGVLYTHDPDILSASVLGAYIGEFFCDERLNFSKPLENFYDESKVIRVSPTRVNHVR